MNYIYGLDVGGTSVKLGLFDENLNLLEKYSFKTNAESGDSIFIGVADAINRKNKELGITMADVIGVGFGLPGAVKDNYVPIIANIKWENVQVEDGLKRYLPGDYKVVGVNDANAAALGEYSLYANDYKDIVFLTLGTGVGGGIIIGGKLIEGAHGATGELGHYHHDTKYNLKCGCGNVGCLETIASANGLVRLAKHYEVEHNLDLFGKDDINAKDVTDLAKAGNPDALNIFHEYQETLALAISNFAVILNPEVFIIGGGLSGAGDFLLDGVIEKFKEAVPAALPRVKETKIILATLGNDAGIYGAAFAARQK